MTESTDDARSREACPVCGEHRLTLLPLPRVDVLGVQPYNELLGFRDIAGRPDLDPAIGCLSCGSEWPDLTDFRLAQRIRRARRGAS